MRHYIGSSLRDLQPTRTQVFELISAQVPIESFRMTETRVAADMFSIV